MLNIYEVAETNKMIEKENLDVRTITLGISLLDCIDSNLDKLMLQAEHLSKNPLIFDEKQKNIKLNDIEYARYIEITKQYKMFEKNFNDLLEDSENIKNLFEEKRKNFDYFKYNILIIIIGYIIFCSILILVKIYFK